MIMSTSNQRASNIFKSSQEPNTNKKNKKRHKIPFNKIQPPITISFNLGREVNKKDVSTYGVYRQSSTICTEGWQPRKVEKNAWWWTLTLNLFSHNTLTQAWRSLKNWWPTMTNKKTIISNIISIESYHPWKHIKNPLEQLTPRWKEDSFPWKRDGWSLCQGRSIELFRHQIPPSIGTHQIRHVRTLDKFATERAGGLVWCCGLRLQPPATAIFLRFSWSGREW